MKTILKFKTNIMCGGCISTVTPFLDSAEGINQWEVNITNNDKILTIHSDGISSKEVIDTLQKAGKNAEFIS